MSKKPGTKTKKKNYRLRKSVRRTFGALFMISAIIVAAIPFPDSAAADASGGGAGGQTAPKLVSYTFNTDSANPVDGVPGSDKEDNISKYNGGVAMVKKGEAETKQALTTRQGTSGAYTIYKQFDFAEASFKDGGAQGTFGYITEYNTTYVTDKTVALTELAATNYVLIEEADYNAFYANGAAKITFDQNQQDVVEKFEQFFKDYTDYQSYQQKYKQWQDGGMTGEAPKAETATGQPITVDPDTFLNDSNKRDYYLFSKHRPYYTEGYRMVPVIDKRNPTNSDNVTIYLLQGGQPPQGKFNDDNGFLIDGTSSIIGIGNNAFEGVVNVDNITLPKEIKYIGDEAFKNSFIKTLKLDGISAIGYSAFEGCSELSTVELAGLETICSAAFMNCTNLSSVTLPYSVSKIGKGAFAGCLKLDNLDLSQVSTTNNATIGEAAFYNCSLGGLNMGEASFQTVEKGAFATTSPGTDNMVKADMSGTGITTFADQVFSGRGKLQEVTMPRNYGATSKATLPTNTFVGCANLAKVLFPDSSTQVTYESDGIFFDVRNEQFVVEGPATDSAGANAAERTATWDTFTSIVLGTDEQGNPIYNPVPYTYQKDGVYYYEVKSGDYILSLDVDPATNTATVASCNYAEGATGDGKLNIPATVGPYAVTKLGNDCFPQKLKEDLQTIQNHSLVEIGDNVFQGCTKLTGVTFGDSLQTIGSNAFQGCTSLDTVVLGGGITQIKDSAFAGCTKLTNITFGAPLQGAASFPRENIGVNALSTGSNNLTVTGIIEDGYGPLEWAMDPQNYVKQEDGVRVLYKSPEPQSLSIILDNRNNLVTLLDYPHYGDINPEVRRKFENGDALTPAEEAAVNAALYVDIPAPIESIDAKGYLNNEKINGQNVPSNNLNITYYFSQDETKERYEDYAKYGLFNGEYTGKYDDDSMDKEDIGNDRVRSVTMHTVKYLPNSSAAISNDVLSDNGLAGGAFYSCGNLETVSLGSAMENVGSLPFLGAHRLSSVASGTEKYVCNNKILYENLPDGTKKVVEVLGSRGNANDRHITVENDPDLASVSAMAVGAVSDVPELTMVDFTGNELLREIPDKAFLASKELSDVVLPNSIRTIGLKSFAEDGNIRVSILGREISLATDAFENTQDAIVFAYDDSAAFNTAKKIASLYSNVDVRALNDVFRVQFFDYDGVTELTEVQYVERGDSADLPDEDPVRPGYIFTGWNKSHKDIQADTVILALYDVDPKNPGGLGPVGGGVSNNGTTSGNTVPGGVDTNGDGVPDVDKDGNKLYALTVTGGNGSGRYAAGTKVSIMATGGATGSAFGNWSSSDASVIFDDSTKAITTLIMPAKDTTVIANYAGQYRLEVKYGSGSGSYAAGTKVAISAVEPPAGKKFYRWTSPTTGLTIESSSSTSTTITMPASNATIEATYSNTGSGTGGGSSSPTNTPTTTQTPSKNKTSVIITRPGISDTGQASAYVSGSTDGFVVKISQSAEADAAALAALEAEYGDMTPIKFAAMDISLYDSTGTTKITNTTGLKINITMPIPDALRPYAGNNKIASTSNNRLEKLGVKFITMNGVPCMSFTATHFSPYVVYVDTGNLAAGDVLDQTPKTGDGIHPKWFLSIGLASISMILFLKKDSKPRYRTKVS